ncbi:MAG: hypothetical protein ACRC8A_09145 [Microcoleaceae cyanobacterium]
MASTLLISLLAILAALSVLVFQNFSPALSLVFLGTQSPALPLSLWILMAIAAGLLTSLLIFTLFQLAPARTGSAFQPSSTSQQVKRAVQPEFVQESAQDSESYRWSTHPSQRVEPEPEPYPESNRYGFVSEPQATTQANDSGPMSSSQISDDWETEVKPIRTWEGHDPAETDASSRSGEKFDQGSDYETQQSPQTKNWSGSVYSYGYQKPDQPETSQPESVYDADYRVIVPPPSAPTQIQSDPDDEDWGLDDEDETQV